MFVTGHGLISRYIVSANAVMSNCVTDSLCFSVWKFSPSFFVVAAAAHEFCVIL